MSRLGSVTQELLTFTNICMFFRALAPNYLFGLQTDYCRLSLSALTLFADPDRWKTQNIALPGNGVHAFGLLDGA